MFTGTNKKSKEGISKDLDPLLKATGETGQFHRCQEGPRVVAAASEKEQQECRSCTWTLS